MNKILLFLSFQMMTTVFYPQSALIQNGVVREQNSGKKPVDGVQIIYFSAIPTTSDQLGKFRLAFADKKAGEEVILKEINKTGYELVNDKELEHAKLSNTDKFGVDIILAKSGEIEAAKKTYYAVSDSALKINFQKEKKHLQAELANRIITEKQYQKKLDALQIRLENQQKTLDDLSRRFSRINFDDESKLFKEALQIFKEGKVEESLKKLETAHLIERTNLRLEERERINEAEDSIIKQKIDNENGIQQDIKLLKFQANLYELNFDIKNAEIFYDQMFKLDSNSLEIIRECASFYRINHLLVKALKMYAKVITHPKATINQKSFAYGNSGDVYARIGKMDSSMNCIMLLKELHEQILLKNPNSTYSKKELSVTYSRLGNMQCFLGKIDTAIIFYKKGMSLVKELYANDRNSLNYKNALSDAFSDLARAYKILGKYDISLSFYKEALTLSKELYFADTSNLEYKYNLAIANESLGTILNKLGRTDSVLFYYQNETNIFKELTTTYPNHMDINYGFGVALEKMGETYSMLNNKENTLKYYTEMNVIFKKLYNIDTTDVMYKAALIESYDKLGNINASMGMIGQATSFYEKSDILISDLYKNNDKDTEIRDLLGTHYYDLGIFNRNYLNNKDKAAVNFEQAKLVYIELVRDSPENLEFKNSLNKIEEALNE